MCRRVCVCIAQSCTDDAPAADGEAYLTTTIEVENKTEHAKQNQEVVQHNTATNLQMWELWRSAGWEHLMALYIGGLQ